MMLLHESLTDKRSFDVEFATNRAIIFSAYIVALHVKVPRHTFIDKIPHNTIVQYNSFFQDPQLLATPIVGETGPAVPFVELLPVPRSVGVLPLAF
jgi:hypothetical protein